MLRDSSVFTATIASGQTASSVVYARNFSMFNLCLPSSFTGTTLTFQTSYDAGGIFQNLYDSAGAAVSLTVAAGRNYDLPAALASAGFFKIVSGTAEAATRTLFVVCKG